MIRPGEPWGERADGSAGVEVAGDDSDLAAAVGATLGRAPGVLIGFAPARSDLARAVGLVHPGEQGSALTMDVLEAVGSGEDRCAVNMVVVGITPDRVTSRHRRRQVRVDVDDRCVFDGAATGVVVANGQFLRGGDVVPRGHPGDGRLEVQVYALAPGERRAMRRRLGGGTHVPHPRIHSAAGRTVTVLWERPVGVEWDGAPGEPLSRLGLRIRAGAYRLWV